MDNLVRMKCTRARALVWFVAWCALSGFLTPRPISAHDIPSDITIHVFVKPDGERLTLLVRLPLEAMRDMSFPLLGPGYLDISKADSELRSAAMLWIGNDLELFENQNRLPAPEITAIRASIPSDRSFGTFEGAREHLAQPPLPEGTMLYWQQALLDVQFEYPISSDRSDFSVDPGLERLGLRVVTVLRFQPPEGEECVYEYTGYPGRVALDPYWYQAAFRFVALGFTHILDGIDHLLFLLCLVIPFRQFRALVAIVTAFTIAHSVTLICSVLGLAPDALWFPPLVETLIAASIVYMAIENIVGSNLHRRWMITFCFGLIHGFGFSFALRETLQFGGTHLMTSLLAFNMGVEIGQLLALAVLVPALHLLYRYVLKERIGTILLSALVAHTAWHWMTTRGANLGEYDFQLTPDSDLLFVMVGWFLVIAASGGLSWWALRGWRPVPARLEETE